MSSENELTQKSAKFEWTGQRLEAANMLAEDELTDTEIAEKLGISRATITLWKRHPEFTSKVASLIKEIGDAALRHAVVHRNRRISWLNDRIRRMRQVIIERSLAPEMEFAPGGTTGLLTRKTRSIGSGENAREVEDYEFDAALVKELREHEKQAAIELGQWQAETQVNVKIEPVTDEDIIERLRSIVERVKQRVAEDDARRTGAGQGTQLTSQVSVDPLPRPADNGSQLPGT